jgi:hypothetical protein
MDMATRTFPPKLGQKVRVFFGRSITGEKQFVTATVLVIGTLDGVGYFQVEGLPDRYRDRDLDKTWMPLPAKRKAVR